MQVLDVGRELFFERKGNDLCELCAALERQHGLCKQNVGARYEEDDASADRLRGGFGERSALNGPEASTMAVDDEPLALHRRCRTRSRVQTDHQEFRH